MSLGRVLGTGFFVVVFLRFLERVFGVLSVRWTVRFKWEPTITCFGANNNKKVLETRRRPITNQPPLLESILFRRLQACMGSGVMSTIGMLQVCCGNMQGTDFIRALCYVQQSN